MKGSRETITKLLIPIFVCAFSQSVLAAPIELSLEDSIALAFKNNPNISIANSSREKSYWAVEQAKAVKGFSLDFTHSDKRYNSSPSYLNSLEQYTYYTKFDNSISLSLPIYSGGKLESQIDQAKLNLKVSDLNIDATKQQIKQCVTTYYFSVLQYHNALQVSQETVDNYLSHLKNVQAQYKAGMTPKSDVLSSEVSLANAQNSLIKAQNNYALAVANLNNAIGLSLDSEIKLNEDLQYEQYSQTLSDCEKYALANRPEMAQYQAKIAIAEYDGKIAKSSYQPTVSFAATEDWYDKEFSSLSHNNWLVSLTASFNIFDSGLVNSKVNQSKASLDTAQEQARQERDTILLEVRQYYLSMYEAEKRIDTSKVAVDQAKESLRIAEVRYAAGVGTNLDVLDALLSQNTAKTNYIQALYDYNTNKAQLDKAMGVAVK
ncbi:MAG: tolC 2 [Firmicutes bacterium]|nr:tolC 2 [Bacillota bacterium]